MTCYESFSKGNTIVSGIKNSIGLCEVGFLKYCRSEISFIWKKLKKDKLLLERAQLCDKAALISRRPIRLVSGHTAAQFCPMCTSGPASGQRKTRPR